MFRSVFQAMYWRFLYRALVFRKQRLMLAFAALAVAATLATVLFGIYSSVDRRMREEFRSYGANLVAVATDGTTVPLGIAGAAEQAGAEAAPFLTTVGRVNGNAVAVLGFLPGKADKLTAYWHIDGTRDLGPKDCLAGETVAKNLHLSVGDALPLEKAPCTLRGIVSTGAAEDVELLVPFATAVRISGIDQRASVIQIRAPGERLEAIRTRLSAQFPLADIRTVRAVAGTESNVILKIRASLLLLTTLILVITTLCVSSNFSELVMERSKEIGILKALGAAERRIAGFFLSEAAALAVAATLLGYSAGLLGAAFIGREVFGGGLQFQPDWLVFLTVALVMLLVASLATAISASRVWSIQPAAILRGE